MAGIIQQVTTRLSTAGTAVWDADTESLPVWQGRGVGALRIAIAVTRDFFRGQLSLRATSLVFTTLLSLVPLLAVAFSVLKGFGVHNELQPALLSFLEPLGEKSIEITDRIIGFVENIKAGVIGAVGLGALFYTVISLMHKIEQAFNYTWHLSQHRSMSERFSVYLSVILIGPVLIFSAMAIAGTVIGSETVAGLAAIQPFGWVIGLLGKIVPYLMIVSAFTFIYVFIPNTKVRVASAIAGALVAGVIWQSTGWVFATFIANSAKYTAIYSAFATLILFMIWLYVSWLVLLIGASIAFYYQNPQYLIAKPDKLILSNRMREKIALLIMRAIGGAIYNDEPPLNADDLAGRVSAPNEALERVLGALEQARLIKQTNDDPPAYLPAKPLETTQLKSVLDAVRMAGESAGFNVDRLPGSPMIDAVMGDLDAAAVKALEGRTVKQLAVARTVDVGDPESIAPLVISKN